MIQCGIIKLVRLFKCNWLIGLRLIIWCFLATYRCSSHNSPSSISAESICSTMSERSNSPAVGSGFSCSFNRIDWLINQLIDLSLLYPLHKSALSFVALETLHEAWPTQMWYLKSLCRKVSLWQPRCPSAWHMESYLFFGSSADQTLRFPFGTSHIHQSKIGAKRS